MVTQGPAAHVDMLAIYIKEYNSRGGRLKAQLLPPIDEILKKHGLPAIEVKAGDVQTPRRIGAEEETTGM